ncbi:hypothetical protein TMatcc_008147 [Talaromyces marneffei ATCC 18224]
MKMINTSTTANRFHEPPLYVRHGFVVTEEQEEIAYRRYAEALSRLEDLTVFYDLISRGSEGDELHV